MGVRGVEESESTETIHLKYYTMAVSDYMYLKKRHQATKKLLLNTLQSEILSLQTDNNEM